MRILEFETSEKLHDGDRTLIYRAREELGQQRVILKILKGEHHSPERLARFRRQFEIARELASPHVLTVHRVASFEGTLVGVLEDFAAESLAACIQRDRPPLREALQIAICICRGLADVHNGGVVHKDICSSNVLWNRVTGIAKISDFGIASRAERTPTAPHAPRLLEGTLAYMSPEQTGRMHHPVDYRTDFYSLGVTLYELFTGKKPFESDDPLELIHAHIARQPVAPNRHEPRLPETVSGILLKLLEKEAEDRYQSAEGVGDDLAECLRQLDGQGPVRAFPLAKNDVRGRFRLPAKLYGREAEAATLVGAFQRVVAGELVFTLVTGYSGVGKSSLVQQLYRPLAVARGRYISGKYDQYQRSVPYSALGRAFDALCDQLLCESPEILGAWRQRLVQALGKNGQALIEVIPRLEAIIGPQPVLPERDPQSAQNLFNQVCQEFVQSVCRPEEPLVLFLDDLQWADIASLTLLRTVLKNPSIRGLHLLGAYRDNEVDSSHPLLLLVDEAHKAGLAVGAVHVDNLTLAHVTKFVADTLSLRDDEAASLACIVHAKTQGNAFFVTEFLKALHADKLLLFDRARLRWNWDVDVIQARQITDNVVELMAGRIRLLPAATQQLLRLAACIGGTFELRTLTLISDSSDNLALVLQSLTPAVQLGVIVPRDELRLHRGGGDANDDPGSDRFSFQHDRVQQAAYSLIPEIERQRVHLDIARHLIDESLVSGQIEERLFEIVSHIKQGAALVTDTEERRRAASLNLQAGSKARKASAHHASLDHFRMAKRFLGEGCFDSDYELAFEIHLGLAKACSIASQFAEADALYPTLLGSARTVMDKVRVHTVQMDDYHLEGGYERAIGVQKEALLLLGEPVPPSDAELGVAIDAELKLSAQYLGRRAIADLADAPEIVSPEIGAAMKTLMSMWMSAYLVSREDLVQWTSVRLANLSLQHGHSETAAFAYVQYGYLCIGRLRRFEEGYEYGRLALTLADRHDDLEMRGKIYFLFGIFINHWTKHVSHSTEAMRRGYLFSVEAGDWTYAVYAAANVVSNLIIAGVHCDEVLAEADKYLQFLQDKAAVGLNSFFLPGGYCALLNLQGRTLAANSFDCEYLDEKKFHETLGHLPIVEAWFYAVKIRSLYLHRAFDEGARVIAKAEVVAEGVPAQVKVPEAYFYSCLMLAAAQHLVGDDATREQHWVLFRKYEAQMKEWAEHCPDNYLHKYCLIAAERIRVEGGSLDEVLGWYDRAIQSAEQGQFANVAAVARELKGRYWLEKKRGSYATADLREALYGYQLWGATRKVAMLEEEFDGLSLGSPGGTDYRPAELDLLSAHKASRAISGKIELEELIQTMMSIVMESAGADRGLLFRERNGRWRIEADAVLGEKDVRVRPPGGRESESHEPARSGAPLSVVHYVVRTQASVTVDDPARDLRFGHDPYIVAVQPKSILCVPLAHQGRTIGVLYLENKLGRDVFTADRRALVDVLTGQMAISLENANLYANVKGTVAEQGRMMADLQRQRTELLRTNEELAEQRAQLAAQAAALRSLNDEVSSSNSELETFSYSVAHDLRAPLRGMNGFATVLLEDYKEKLDAEGIDCLREIHSNALRMGELIDAMLALAQVSRCELRPETVDLASLARAVASEFAAAEPQRRVDVVIQDGIQGVIDLRLARVLLENLLGNAWKFTRNAAAPRIEFGTVHDGGPAACFVRDNGVGFDMAYADKLFGPFQRLHSAREFPGTGVGLATAKRIVHRSGGRIWAEGQVGSGATLHFTVPQPGRTTS